MLANTKIEQFILCSCQCFASQQPFAPWDLCSNVTTPESDALHANACFACKSFKSNTYTCATPSI